MDDLPSSLSPRPGPHQQPAAQPPGGEPGRRGIRTERRVGRRARRGAGGGQRDGGSHTSKTHSNHYICFNSPTWSAVTLSLRWDLNDRELQRPCFKDREL